MKLLQLASAACLAASLALAAPAAAAPFAGPLQPVPGASLVVPARGCHPDVRRHYVPEAGRSVRHFHRGRNCRPVRVGGGGDGPGRGDCHRDARRHYLPQYGGPVVHRHVGPNCRVRVLRRHSGGSGGVCVTIGPIRYCED